MPSTTFDELSRHLESPTHAETSTQQPKTRRRTVHARMAHFGARVRSTTCPRSVAILVRTMTAHRDPEAIPVLLGLLDLPDEYVGNVENALVRYGESAEDSLKAYAVANAGVGCTSAIHVLSRIAYRARLRQAGCF